VVLYLYIAAYRPTPLFRVLNAITLMRRTRLQLEIQMST